MSRPQEQSSGLADLIQILGLVQESGLSLDQVRGLLNQVQDHEAPRKSRTITATTTKASKVELGKVLKHLIERQGLTHMEASKLLQTSRVRVTKVCTDKVDSISLDALMDFLIILGQEVKITATP